MNLMTPEERFERIERQLEFIASIQAQNSAQIDANSRNIAQLADLTLRIGRIVETQAGHIDALTQRMDQLAQAQARTEDRLNALIIVVERYFSNGHK